MVKLFDMSSKFLFSNQYRIWSSILFVTSFFALCLALTLEWSPEFLDVPVLSLHGGNDIFNSKEHSFILSNNILDEILTILAVISGLIWAFSKERIEDEFVSSIRKDALILAVFVNYGLYLLATIFIYGLAFMQVLMLNVFTILIFFLIIFNWKKYQLHKSSDEE